MVLRSTQCGPRRHRGRGRWTGRLHEDGRWTCGTRARTSWDGMTVLQSSREIQHRCCRPCPLHGRRLNVRAGGNWWPGESEGGIYGNRKARPSERVLCKSSRSELRSPVYVPKPTDGQAGEQRGQRPGLPRFPAGGGSLEVAFRCSRPRPPGRLLIRAGVNPRRPPAPLGRRRVVIADASGMRLAGELRRAVRCSCPTRPPLHHPLGASACDGRDPVVCLARMHLAGLGPEGRLLLPSQGRLRAVRVLSANHCREGGTSPGWTVPGAAYRWPEIGVVARVV